MTNTPKVSVIIPTYNRAHLVGRAIRSVLSQTFQDLEIYVVDDASTDNTEEVVHDFGDRRIKYLKHDVNNGAPAARNLGIRSSNGEYIAFLDSDDEWLPEKLEKQLEVMRTSNLKSLGVVMCGVKRIRSNEKEITWIPEARGWLYEDLLTRRLCMVGTPQLLVKRDAVDPVVLFDETLPAYQDWDYLLRLARHCQVDYVPEVLWYAHRSQGERVFTRHNRFRAWDILLKKYATELRRWPHVKANLYKWQAAYCYEIRDINGVRANQFEALKVQPLDFKAYPRIVASLLGLTVFEVYLKTTRQLRAGVAKLGLVRAAATR